MHLENNSWVFALFKLCNKYARRLNVQRNEISAKLKADT